MSGIIIVNKPQNYTSRDVVNIISRELHEKKVGHTGTLDPLATGVLVVCVGKYTKLVDRLTSLNKEYIAEIKLGIETDTLDITGNILKQEDVFLTKTDILKAFSNFIGEYQMEVPLYSAIKVNGKKLYEYAREGIQIDLPVKIVHIYELELLSFYQNIITFRCLVEKGTYIRSLIRDIMNYLGVIGTMNNLVRVKQGNFKIEQSCSLEDIKNHQFSLFKIQDVLNIPVYDLSNQEFIKVKNGNEIFIDRYDEEILLIYQNQEIAIYKKKDQLYKPSVMLI